MKERHHVHLNEGDWDFLTQTYGPKGLTNSAVIALLVSKHVRFLREKIATKLDAAGLSQLQEQSVDIELDLPSQL